jgi:hypothetical protein
MGGKGEGERGIANEQIMRLIFMSQMLMKTKFNTRLWSRDARLANQSCHQDVLSLVQGKSSMDER